MTDYISRADAIEAVESLPNTPNGFSDTYDKAVFIELLEELPSADAESDDLIIKGAKGIKDGLYNITDGKLFQYKAKGGTVRAYPIVPSAETHEIRTETHGVCLISKDDAMGAVQDHFNANGFKGYDDGQKMMDRINAMVSILLPPSYIWDMGRIPAFVSFIQEYDNPGCNIPLVFV